MPFFAITTSHNLSCLNDLLAAEKRARQPGGARRFTVVYSDLSPITRASASERRKAKHVKRHILSCELPKLAVV
jgi:hypothetical protein